MKNNKDRGIKLSSGRVRECCEACRIHELAELEIAYDEKIIKQEIDEINTLNVHKKHGRPSAWMQVFSSNN